MSMMDTVYITRFNKSAIADTAAETPWFIIISSAAGCPPAAEGVSAEK